MRRLILQNNAFRSRLASSSSSKTCWKICLRGRVNIRHHERLSQMLWAPLFLCPTRWNAMPCLKRLYFLEKLLNGRNTAQLNHFCVAPLASPPSAVHAPGWRCTSSSGISWLPAARRRAPYRVTSKERTAISSKKHCALLGKQRVMRLLVWRLSHPPMSSLDTPMKKAL